MKFISFHTISLDIVGVNMNSYLPDPKTNPELFENVLLRRIIAFIIDSIIIGVIMLSVTLIIFIAGIATFGITWLTLPLVLPFSILFYYASTLGSHRRASVGMQMFDLVLTPTKGLALDGWRVLIHPIVFWLTIWVFAPLLFIGLFTARRQLLHDLLTSTMMIRRSPMRTTANSS